MKYDADFVLKVNEVYHDIEGEEHVSKHPDIFIDEAERWREIGRRFIANDSQKVTLLDIGSGTAFVPCGIGNFLKEGDLCACSDISSTMLDVCKKNISEKNFKCQFKYLKLNGKQIDFESDFFTHITLNAVLHHIPDFSLFFKEVDRLLQVQGRFIIVHEPNKPFYTHKFLWKNYRACIRLWNPKSYISDKLKTLGLLKASDEARKDRNNANLKRTLLVDEVNKCLLKAGVVEHALTPNDISDIVDIKSPTAGDFHEDRGIDISEILQDYLPNYELMYFETYNHLGQLRNLRGFMKVYDSLLKKLFPKTGAYFSAVLIKVGSL
ncbi:MAG: class I SAM-dependent methyltransferase [Planctomycetota bacterium]|jgi:ubiquinone/menaquinone biosynthesis C-methylase UbiE